MSDNGGEVYISGEERRGDGKAYICSVGGFTVSLLGLVFTG